MISIYNRRNKRSFLCYHPVGVNLMRLMATKNIYFVPFGQDAPEKKPNSMVARMELLEDTVLEALQGKQLQPVVVEKFRYMN
ncbi:dipicolinate synthase [Bacillus thuringiensis]|nr:dipicolinate synthase [Bacillus thuringiensis]TXR65637.1 dipicolinate synthase [Bacillus sp. AR18-7]HEF1901515.1 dipicolinate synthase [Bacillus cereus]PEB73274.1 dipicolinate synthase [Bacillus thuringiensis]PET18222.1 dipicolinate synthase [Bacillus thuringiensis]